MRVHDPRLARAAYALGDYAAGAATAIAAAVPVHAVVDPGMDVVVAMMLGTLLGTLAHLLVLGVAAPLVGFFQAMAPGGLIGMYGGMLFGMRDAMQATSWLHVVVVAVLFGLAVVAALRLYDRALRSDQPPL
jgi:uncharacterized membrane protein